MMVDIQVTGQEYRASFADEIKRFNGLESLMGWCQDNGLQPVFVFGPSSRQAA